MPADRESAAAPDRVRIADAVARVWIVGLMRDEHLRVCAHPLSCVRAALDGETDPIELGCDPAEFEAAMRTSTVEELREVLGVRI